MLLHERFPNTIQFPLVFGWVGGCLGPIFWFSPLWKTPWPLPDWWWRGVLVLCRATFGLLLGVFGKKTQCSLGLLCQFWIDVDQCNLKVVERWFEFKFIQMILNRWKFVSCTPSYSVDLFWILFFPVWFVNCPDVPVSSAQVYLIEARAEDDRFRRKKHIGEWCWLSFSIRRSKWNWPIWTVTSKAAKLWPVGSGLCFIAHSLEQHDQAATKGAFVIRPKKGWAGRWVMGDVSGAFILQNRLFGDLGIFKYSVGFNDSISLWCFWGASRGSKNGWSKASRYWLDFCWCANFVGVTGLRAFREIRFSLIWITFEIVYD